MGELWSMVAVAAVFWLVLHYALYRLLRGKGRAWLKAKASRLAVLLSMMIIGATCFGAEWLPWLPRAHSSAAASFGGIGVIVVNGAIFLFVAALGVALVRALARRGGGAGNEVNRE